MTLTELAAIALGWTAVIYTLVLAWRRFCVRQSRRVAPPQKCGCSMCTRKQPVQGIVLEEQQLGEVQAGVYAVTSGMGHTAVVGWDYVTAGEVFGAGRVVVIVCDGTTYERVVSPVLDKHEARAT